MEGAFLLIHGGLRLVAVFETVVGTIEGVKTATKIKTDLKKPITELACHPRHPVLVFPLFALTAAVDYSHELINI